MHNPANLANTMRTKRFLEKAVIKLIPTGQSKICKFWVFTSKGKIASTIYRNLALR